MSILMSPPKVIELLESNNSRTYKETVLATQVAMNNDELFEGCKLALDSMITFGVKKVPMWDGNKNAPGVSWDHFKALAKALSERKYTGNDARDAIIGIMSSSTEIQWNNWYRRILIKDLRCGVSEKTINTVAKRHGRKDYMVPVFTCQLAHDSAKHESKLVGRKMIEVKLDGVRVISILYPNGHVVQFSRNGKELLNFEVIKEQLSKACSKFSEPYVLDGEVMSASFQDLMTQVNRKRNVQADDSILHLFDIVPLRAFQKGKFNLGQEERTKGLKLWYGEFEDVLENVQILEHEIVDLDTEKGQRDYGRINKKALAGGYEGIMVKDLNAIYECKRSTSWLKLKPFIEVSLKVVDVEEGTGKNEGSLGALVCKGKDDGKEIEVNVGSGFTDEHRNDYWTNRKKVIGMVAEIRADTISQNKDGTYSLRFPRFLRFRGFDRGEKI